METFIEMSEREISRLEVLKLVVAGMMTQVEAGKRLSLTDRQIRRLLERYSTEGARGLVHRRRGRPSNHRTEERLRKRIIKITMIGSPQAVVCKSFVLFRSRANLGSVRRRFPRMQGACSAITELVCATPLGGRVLLTQAVVWRANWAFRTTRAGLRYRLYD